MYFFQKIRISKRCPTHMSPKRVIHVQASFNNIIMTVTYAHGYKSTSKRTSFATQSAVGNAIQIVVDQELSAICRSRILLSFIQIVSHVPHNGNNPHPRRRHL
ncbi:Ribosomal protein [Parasponia andersonii]|uniref:Ribosomal protein n=1 Tax=Parasponia andersonii TaxID=3476 RepID=A0A2P5AVB0_PARAD|nr:Ribosomal protein [Parasponia andersonii]